MIISVLSSRACRLFHCQELVSSAHTLWIHSSTAFWGSSFWALGLVYWAHWPPSSSHRSARWSVICCWLKFHPWWWCFGV